MSETDVADQDSGESPVATPRSRTSLRGPAVQAVAILAAYVAVGAVAGWLWHRLWSPSEGVVVGHVWIPGSDALRGDFSGTALYVLVAAAAGFGLGAACALAGDRRPVLTLVAAVAGSVLAAWLMLEVGQGLGPTDPHELAKTAARGTRLPSALRVSGLSPRLTFPVGTLAGLALVFLVFPGKSREFESDREPRR